MQLLRLEMKGFKSFADKTILQFSPGMTAIVGPNGSGKSNITDAMRWVLGESNVRNLRGQRAEDIIFSGTEKRKPLSSAEVTLIFDNKDHALAVDFPEVAITRRMYRNGDSEFLINKRTVRLKDIHLLLADTGLSRDSMAIIGQNRIDAILNSKPEERRIIFEDVAGIGRFKLNKEDALRRIHSTDRNMERVRDLMAALEEQLEPLEEKAKKTEQYMSLSRQKRVFDGALLYHDYKTADRLFTRQENEQLALTNEEIELQTRQAALEASKQETKLALEKARNGLTAYLDAYSQRQQELERCRGDLRLLEEQKRSLGDSLAKGSERLEQLQVSLAANKQQIVLLEKLIEEEKSKIESLEEAHKQAQALYEDVSRRLTHKQADVKAHQSQEQVRQEEERQRVRQQEALRAERQALADKIGDLQRQAQEWDASYREAVQALGEAEATYKDKQVTYTSCEQTLQVARQALQQHQTDIKESQRRVSQIEREKQRKEGRLQILSQWDQQHEGYMEGIRNVLASQKPWLAGIRGAIGDLFTVEPTYVTAIDIALGASIQHMVTTTSKVASEAVAYLKETKGGRVTFLPMEAVHGRLGSDDGLDEPGVLGRAVDCISFDEAYRDIFTYLLGRTLLIQDMQTGIALQRKYKGRLRMVTLEGESFQPGGSLTGGVSKRRKASVLQRKEEARALEDQLEALKQEENHWNQLQSQGQAQEEILQKKEETARQALQEEKLQVISSESIWQTKKDALKRLERQGNQTKQALRLALDRQKELDSQWASYKDIKEEEPVEALQLLEELEVLQADQQKAYEELTQFAMEEERLKERLQGHQQDCSERQSRKQEEIKEVDRLKEEKKEQEERLQVLLPAQLRTLEERLKGLRDGGSGSERQDLEARVKQQESALQVMEEEDKQLGDRYRLVQKRLVSMQNQLANYKFRGEQAQKDLSQIGYTLEEGQALQPQGGVADWKTAQASLKVQIEQLGAVNPEAPAEWEEAKNRYSFYETQRDDLDKAKEQLETVIAEIDKAMSSRLLDVLDVVGRRFQEIFQDLFGGGSAQIAITGDDDSILTGGIDFYIQPPGKKRQQLTLLSGGERALTVIALLFAFLDYRPAPFCVLDEVDAALDEANVERFSRYLGHIDKTQFIVVSHRKKTMESAKVLQGVTMVERGVSRLLTVSFDEWEE